MFIATLRDSSIFLLKLLGITQFSAKYIEKCIMFIIPDLRIAFIK